MRFRLVVSCVAISVVATAWAAESPEKLEARRPAEQAQTYKVVDRDPRKLPRGEGPQDLQEGYTAPTVNPSIIQDDRMAQNGLGVRSVSPGIEMASTTWETQYYDAAPHQIATNGSGKYIHFAWTQWDVIPTSVSDNGRSVNFNTYESSTASFRFGSGGVVISGAGGNPPSARAGFATLDIDDQDLTHIAFHQRGESQQPSGHYSSWEVDQVFLPNFAIFIETYMSGSEGVLEDQSDDVIWPHVTVDQIPAGSDVIHVVASAQNSNGNIVYWRYKSTDAPTWKGPYVLDSTISFSYNIAADRTSEKCALITVDSRTTVSNPNGLLQVTYRESLTNGNDWGPVNTTGIGDAKETFITNYVTGTGPQAWVKAVGDYDNAGNLHVVWAEQRFANTSNQAALKHWDKASDSTSTVSLAYYDSWGAVKDRDINLSHPTLGFGDGSTTCGGGTNLNYVYITFVQFGGISAAQQSDFSAKGNMNGDIYLTASNNGGLLWSTPVNLTNTLSPGCDPQAGDSCASENWPSMARTVDDTIHIMYVTDRDAGSAVYGYGTWTFNPVMYYRIPGGTNVQPVCPLIAPNAGAELSNSSGGCERNTPPNTSVGETLMLSNAGNDTLSGAVSHSYIAPSSGTWLTVTGEGSYDIAPGGANLNYPVTMSATGLAEGLYKAKISITHNDPTKSSPFEIPVDFFVFTNFACPQYVVLNTGWLQLEVSSIGRLTVGPDRGSSKVRGLYRSPAFGSPDSGNNTIYDASLIIAKPPSPDTFVYRYIFGQGNGMPGFRALSDLTVDTSAYGTNAGYASANARLTTVDSTIGIDVEYIFPQAKSPNDSSEFVLVKYRLYNRTGSPILGLITGEAADFDVRSSTQYDTCQVSAYNQANWVMNYNLIYQQGKDRHSMIHNTVEKYLGGMTAIQSTAAPRAWCAPNDPWLYKASGGGFYEGYLYRELVKSGFEVFYSPGWWDLHSVIAFEKNVNLQPATVKHYMLGFVTSTQGPYGTDLIDQTKKAWKFAFGWQEIVVNDTMPPNTPASYPYWAMGSHQDGLSSGCCGCVVTKTGGSGLLTFSPDANPCSGTINFAGSPTPGIYTATFQVQTPACGGPQYTDDQLVTIFVSSSPTTVLNLDDSGPGSLRWAIDSANAIPGPDTIAFTVAGTIQLQSPLPPLSDLAGGTAVLGFSAPGASSPYTPAVILDGSGSSLGPGLRLQSSNNRVEGLAFQDCKGPGVEVTGSSSLSNTISSNLFHGNTGPEIDLGGDGVTPNDPGDADTGPNTLLNYPVFDSVIETGVDTFTVYGTSAPSSRVELFLAAKVGDPGLQPEATVHGPAYALLGWAAAGGDGSFSFPGIAMPEWSLVTATATDPAGNTSELALNKPLTPDPLRITAYSEPVPPVRGVLSMPLTSPTMQVVVFSPPNALGKRDTIGPPPMWPNTFGSRATYDSLTDYDSRGKPDTRVKIVSPDTGEYQIKYVLIGDPGNYLTGIGIDGHAEVKGRVAFAAMGQVIDTTYQLAPPPWCACPNQGDISPRPTGDGVIDVFDVIEIIGIAFSGSPDIQDPPCPKTRGDVDNNGVTDVFDVIYLIATAFSGGANPLDPCAP